MKKLLALMMSVLMIASLAACGSSETPAETTAPETAAVETTAAPETAAPETAEATEEPTEGAPTVEEGRFIDEEPVDMLDIAGLYTGTNYSELDLSMYTDPDTVAVGTFTITDQDGNAAYSGEIQEAMTNYYCMLDADLTMTVYTDNGTVCLDVYADGEHLDYFIMVEPYVS